MLNAVIFKDLPATFPEEDRHKKPAAICSLTIHVVLVTAVILVPLLVPERIQYSHLLTMIAPLAPPPPTPAAPQIAVPIETKVRRAVPEVQREIQVDPGTIITPMEIPKEIARIVDEAPVVAVSGVTGGITNASVSGILRNVLLAENKSAEVAPPPPPPPPPAVVGMPVRVGGNIQEPKVVKLVAPVYPKLAIKARVKGTVILEATVTADGTVDEIRVISGNPLLTQAAIDCVKQWRYEPTYLNGDRVAVILPARVNFELGPVS